MPISATKSHFPAPSEGLLVTHLLIVSDQDRSREFYHRIMVPRLSANATPWRFG